MMLMITLLVILHLLNIRYIMFLDRPDAVVLEFYLRISLIFLNQRILHINSNHLSSWICKSGFQRPGTFYHPPPLSNRCCQTNFFLAEFSLLIAGNFNFHVENSANITIEFMFAGTNMFWARLRLILARAAITINIALEGIEKTKTEKNDNKTL